MPRKAGTPKTGGRKKGTPNKKSIEFLELAEKFDLTPGEVLIKVAKGESFTSGKKAKGQDQMVHHPSLDQMIAADKELTQYTYPKRKAVEHSGDITLHEAMLDELE